MCAGLGGGGGAFINGGGGGGLTPGFYRRGGGRGLTTGLLQYGSLFCLLVLLFNFFVRLAHHSNSIGSNYGE